MFEKEAFPIVNVFKKLDYLLLGMDDAHIFTDHRNLLFVFAPLVVEPKLRRHIVSKVQRWALFLSTFPYVIEHIRGEDNVCADMLTRWCRGYRRVDARKKTERVCALVLTDTEPTRTDSEELPSLAAIRQAQQEVTVILRHIVRAENGIFATSSTWDDLGTIGGASPPDENHGRLTWRRTGTSWLQSNRKCD